jgi:GT2 family glycosyltransferase
MDNPRVAIIILNWNGWEDTVECLESVYQINYKDFRVLVVDNNSSDDSIKKINEYVKGELKVESKLFKSKNKPNGTVRYDKEKTDRHVSNTDQQLILIKNKKNYGFAEGNNIGIKYALKNLNPDYILLLNNDTVVDKDFLKELVKEGENNGKIGLLGPKIYYFNNPNVIWSTGGKIDWNLARGLHIGINEDDKGQYDEKMTLDYINGSALLIKKEVIDSVGLLDKKFFLYFEETDLALRASLNGYESLYIPNAKVWHKVSVSSGGIKDKIGIYYITRNRWLFMKKWANKGNYFIFAIIQILGAVILPTFISVYYKNRKLFLSYYKGLWDGITSN